MESNTTFFTGTIDPQTGDIRSQRIDTRRELSPSDLIIDVHYSPELCFLQQLALDHMTDTEGFTGIEIAAPNTDPTLARFYEPKQETRGDENYE